MTAQSTTTPDATSRAATSFTGFGKVILVAQLPWLLALLAYGYDARVLTGPKLSPLGLFVTRVAVPRLPFAERPVPGPPKRFAQGIGATLSLLALVLHYTLGWTAAAYVLVGMILAAASLEAFAGFCLGCWVFARLMQLGVIPESVCRECADFRKRPAAA